MQLIDANAREQCFSVSHRNSMAAPYTVDEKFLAYHEFDKWEALHNGACVYECYAEVLGISWSDIVDSLVQIEISSLPKRKCLVILVLLSMHLFVHDCSDGQNDQFARS